MILLAHSQRVFHTTVVGRHDRAVDVQVAVSDGAQDVGSLRIDHHGRRALARAVVHAHDHAAVGLDGATDLVDHAAHRAAGDQDALGICRDRALARVVGLAQLGNLLLQLLRIGLDIKTERTGKHGAHQVDAAHSRRLIGLQGEHLELGRTQTVATAHGGAQVVIGNRDAVEALELLLEQAALLVPAFTLVGAIATLRKMQNVRALELVEQLVHLLLAVAGGLADDHVAKVRKRALLRVGKAVRRFDERTQICRQHLLGLGNHLIGRTAQSDTCGPRGIDNLERRIAAQEADQAIARLFVILNANKRRLALLVELLKRGRQRLFLDIGHSSSPLLHRYTDN